MHKPIPDLNKCCHFYFITLSHLSSVFSYDEVEVESLFFMVTPYREKRKRALLSLAISLCIMFSLWFIML